MSSFECFEYLDFSPRKLQNNVTEYSLKSIRNLKNVTMEMWYGINGNTCKEFDNKDIYYFVI